MNSNTRRTIDEQGLERAAAALRDAPVPDGPPPELDRATLTALWAAEAQAHEARRASRGWVGKALLAGAAVLGVAAVVALILMIQRHDQQTPNYTLTPPARATPRVPVTPSGEIASVTGRVRFTGPRPVLAPISVGGDPHCAALHPAGMPDESLVVDDSGGIANVVVSLRMATQGLSLSGTAPTTPAKLDQKGCRFDPHVLAVMVGQPISVSNSDPFLHNVHSLAVDNPYFNFGQPNLDPGHAVDPMKVPEVFHVKCDVHPWMHAYVHVFNHPFFAVTGPDGSFAIPGPLPDGKYVLKAWHEKLGESELPLTFRGGLATGVEVTFSPTEATKGPAPSPG